MSCKVHVLMGKDSPLVKELYGLFANDNIPLDVKPAKYKNKHTDMYGHIEMSCWQNTFNKAKKMAQNDDPPPDISTYYRVCYNVQYLFPIMQLLITPFVYTDLPLAPRAADGGSGRPKQTKMTKYIKSVCPSVAQKSDDVEYNDESVGMKDVLPEDEIGSVVVLDMESTVPKCSINNNYLISKFLSTDGRQHVIVLYNLLSL